PGAAPGGGVAGFFRRSGDGVPDQPGHLVGGGVSGVQRTGGQCPTEPLGLVGPAGQFPVVDGVVVDAQQLLGALVAGEDLGEQAQPGAGGALPQAYPQVDLLGPKVLGPHVPVHLLVVVVPAGSAVGGVVQGGRPLGRRVGAVGHPQVYLGVVHADRRKGDGDVGGECLAFLGSGEFVGDGGQAEVGPGLAVAEQHAVVEVADRQSGRASGPPGAAHVQALPL